MLTEIACFISCFFRNLNMPLLSLCRVTDLQNKIASRCLQLHGGWGYMWEYPIAKAFVDSRLQPIYGGSNEIMKELIARSVVTDKQ